MNRQRETEEFVAGRSYTDVYFMSVDAKGHSSIVEKNDQDKVDKAFDGFERVVYEAVDDRVAEHRCSYAKFWGWAGDGGLCIFYDGEESRARRTALEAAWQIIEELDHLNEHLRSRAKVEGTIGVRIAVHKGAFTYKGDDRRGSIHSRELNFCVHLEKVVPVNSVGISEDVQRLLAKEDDGYFAADPDFEGRKVFIRTGLDRGEAETQWRETIARVGGLRISVASDVEQGGLGCIGVYSQRGLSDQFRQTFAKLQERLWVMGISLAGFRADHEESVKELLAQEIDVRLLLAEPDRNQLEINVGGEGLDLPTWCDLETDARYNASHAGQAPAWIHRVNESLRHDGRSDLPARYYRTVPSAAVFIADNSVFVSPFMATGNNVKLPTYEFLAERRQGALWVDRFSRVWGSNELSRPFAAD